MEDVREEASRFRWRERREDEEDGLDVRVEVRLDEGEGFIGGVEAGWKLGGRGGFGFSDKEQDRGRERGYQLEDSREAGNEGMRREASVV